LSSPWSHSRTPGRFDPLDVDLGAELLDVEGLVDVDLGAELLDVEGLVDVDLGAELLDVEGLVDVTPR
jgi:hypothetical protein